MTRFTSIEDAIQQALVHARDKDHDQTLLCLAFALAQTSRARQRDEEGAFPLERAEAASTWSRPYARAAPSERGRPA